VVPAFYGNCRAKVGKGEKMRGEETAWNGIQGASRLGRLYFWHWIRNRDLVWGGTRRALSREHFNRTMHDPSHFCRRKGESQAVRAPGLLPGDAVTYLAVKLPGKKGRMKRRYYLECCSGFAHRGFPGKTVHAIRPRKMRRCSLKNGEQKSRAT